MAKQLVKYTPLHYCFLPLVLFFYYEPLLIVFALPLAYKHVPTASLLLCAAESL